MKTRMVRSAGALALGTALVMATPAASSARIVGDTGAVDPHQISCPADTASLSIQLPEHNPEHDRGLYPVADGSGYEFTLQRVSDIDLTDESTWQEIRTLSPAEAKKRELQAIDVQVTSDDRKVSFNNIGIGVYLVTVTPPKVDGKAVYEVADFVVTAPLAMPDGWHCDGSLYAKAVPAVELSPTPPTQPPGEQTPPAEEPGPQRPGGQLPRTGADIAGLIGLALALVGAGVVMTSRRSKQQQDR